MRHPDLNPAEPSCACGDGLTADEGTDLSRRGFVASTIIGAAAVMAGATVLHVPPAMAQSTMTPDAALKALMDGNQRYVGGNSSAPARTWRSSRPRRPRNRNPSPRCSRAPILACRWRFVFDQSIGQLFVVRVAGNIATPEIIASLEYGVAVLGTKVRS